MNTSEQGLAAWSFHADGISCIKCIRKIQAVAYDCPGIEHLKVDLGLKKIEILSDSTFEPEDFILKVKKIGFGLRSFAKENQKRINPTRLNHSTTNTPEFSKASSHPLIYIGVSAFCAGNIMLFSAADYLGATSEVWFKLFPVLSAVLFLPVLLFAALPFYKNAYFALLGRRLSIDIPLVLAILGGALLSYYNILTHRPEIYFDSISMFIFLLLSSRFLISRIQSHYLEPIKVEDVHSTSWVWKQDEELENINQQLNLNHLKRVSTDLLEVDDVIRIEKNQFLPVDGELLSSEALISDSFFSGEYLPKVKSQQDLILAGSKNLSEFLILKVKKTANETRLAEIITKLNHSLGQKTEMTTLADRASSLFVIGVVVVSVFVLAYFSLSDFHKGLNRVLALLVVACPCGIAIVIPLLQTLALKKGFKKNILIKNPLILENLNKVKTIFFDKTGTLTSGEIQVLGSEPRPPTDFEKQIIFNLEHLSEHPIAKALMKWVGIQDRISIMDHSESLGRGVSGFYENDFYEVKSSENRIQSSVGFYKNKSLVLSIALEDTFATGVKDVMRYVSLKKINPYILTGDLTSHALKVAEFLSISPQNVHAEVSPEEKLQIVKTHSEPAMYVGDGVNDSIAMSACLVSVSMESSANVAFKTSSVHILSEGLLGLKSLFEISENYLKAIQVTVLLFFIYNSIFAVLALLGFIHPLIAVFLMPISSITVTFCALFLMRDRKS